MVAANDCATGMLQTKETGVNTATKEKTVH